MGNPNWSLGMGRAGPLSPAIGMVLSVPGTPSPSKAQPSWQHGVWALLRYTDAQTPGPETGTGQVWAGISRQGAVEGVVQRREVTI